MDDSAQAGERPSGKLRYLILTLLFIATTVNYADRATLSIAGIQMQSHLGVSVVTMGYLFSAFGWSYVAAQIPGGWLLDRYGSRRVYLLSILVWSVLAVAQGAVGFLRPVGLVAMLFVLRLGVGMAEAPVFPGNSRIVAAWFPTGERGTAAAVFNSAQYFAPVAFAPLQAWITHRFGWQYVFIFMGMVALVLLFFWRRSVYSPRRHPRISASEFDYIAAGGAQVEMDSGAEHSSPTLRWTQISQLLRSRMLIGVYIAQYCITTLTYFFLTWFPIYLVRQRGMSILAAGFVASLPAICGFVGGVLGGILSDTLLRRGYSLTVSRKLPIIVGLLLSTVMIACNFIYADWLVVGIMSLAFFGKGVGALGWAVVADTSPRRMAGLSGALFNTFGNTAAITTPIIIGYIVAATGTFAGALVFVVANAVVAILSYLLVVGPIARLELKDSPSGDDDRGIPGAVKS
jgi:MFS transporter, ACS family, glucarate transporter